MSSPNSELSHKKKERAERRRRVAAYYIRGTTQQAIARQEGVNQATISRDLKAIRERWMKEAAHDYDIHIGQQLAKIDAAETEAWIQWEKSKTRQKTKTITKPGSKEGTTIVAQTTIETQYPDPKYLDIIRACIDRRCKLLGLDAPERREVSGPDGGPIQTEDLTAPDERAAARLLAILDRGREERSRESNSTTDDK